MSIVCPKCGKTVPNGKFCIECGAPLQVKCHKCGAKLLVGAKFCIECGAKIEETPDEPNQSAMDRLLGTLRERIDLPEEDELEGSEKKEEADSFDIECPTCGRTVTISEETVMSGSTICPFCDNKIEWDVTFDEIDDDEIDDELIEFEVGEEITFGSYPQEEDGPLLPIEWIILDKKEDRLFVVSKKVLDFKPFDTSDKSTWETSSLRKWLNGPFITSAFDEERQSWILNCSNMTPKEQGDDPSETIDKVFLLSSSDIKKYFRTAEDSICQMTPYAYSVWRKLPEDRQPIIDYPNAPWFLRTPGSNSFREAAICEDGKLFLIGFACAYPHGVRPAMWIEY